MTIYNVVKKARELNLGDVVRLGDGGYMTATVIKITEDEKLDNGLTEYGRITFFRPYVHTSKIETTAGIIPYTGFEQFDRPRNSDDEFFCYETGKILIL